MNSEKLASRLLGLLIAMCFVVVTIGGFVRLSGSGLSIPQWPLFTVDKEVRPDGSVKKSYGLVPPSAEEEWEHVRATYIKDVPRDAGIAMSTFKRMFWIEWSHRAFVTCIGFVYLALMIVTWRDRALRAKIGGLVFSGFFLLIAQMGLGGLVVLFHLKPAKVAFHLVTAFIFTMMLVWALMKLKRPAASPELLKGPNPIRPLAHIVLALVVIQIFSGGLMAASQAGFQWNTWPKMGEEFVPNGLYDKSMGPIDNFVSNKVLIQFFHRWFAFAAAAGVLYLVMRSLTVRVSRPCRIWLRVLMAVVTLQVLLGIATLLMGVNTHLALTHQAVGLVLMLNVFLIFYESKYHPVAAEEALVAEEELAKASAAKGMQNA
jgi:cytochrome c oxidase assembly protein subunit 15